MMNYQTALKDFKKVNDELNGLKFSEEIAFDDNVIQLEVRAISMLIVRHYTGDIKGQGEIWGNHLVQIPKSAINNHIRLKNIRALVSKIVEDIQSRIEEEDSIQKGKIEGIVHHDDEGKALTLKQLIKDFDSLERTNRLTGRTLTETSRLFEQSKARISELDYKLSQAESEKTKLRQEIQRLEAKVSANNNSELAKYQESVAEHIRQETQKDNEQIRKLKNDYQLFQSDINALRAEKETLSEQLERSKKELENEKSKPSERNKKLIFILKIVIFLFFGYVIYDFISQYGLIVVLLLEGTLFALLLITFTKPQDRLIQIITLTVAILAVLASIILPPIINSN